MLIDRLKISSRLNGFMYLIFAAFITLPLQLSGHEQSDYRIEFVENKGQWEANILYKADLSGNGWLFLESGNVTYLFLEEKDHHDHHDEKERIMGKVRHDGAEGQEVEKGHVYKVQWKKSNPFPEITAEQSYGHHSNFFLGNLSENWKSEVKSWKTVKYHQLYDNIDFQLYSQGKTLKSDYIVKKGGEPAHILLEYDGVDHMRIDEHGRLHIKTSVNEIYELAPYSYQTIDGIRKEVKTKYALDGNLLSFSFPEGYDREHDLIIDPSLIFSTYSESTTDNWGASATYDSQGNMYLGGIARGARYPTTTGAFQTSYGGGAGSGGCDVVITKFSSDGTSRLYSTYLGGQANELLSSLYSTEEDELIALVITGSNNFPITSDAYQRNFRGGTYASVLNESMFFQGTDIAIVKFSKDGSLLKGGTYYGGTGNDGLNYALLLNYNYGDISRGDIAVDKEGNIYIASTTNSTNLTGTTGSIQPARGGDYDALVVKFNENLSRIHWATYYGGASPDAAYSIQLDAENNVYIAGGTRSREIVKTTNGLYPVFKGGDTDGFIAKISHDGKTILSDTYLGTASYDQVHIMDLDKDGNVYVFGQTLGAYPITEGAYHNPGAKQFIHKLNPDLNQTLYSTVFGTPNSRFINIVPTAFMVDICGNVYAVGWGGESNYNINKWLGYTDGMPVTTDAFMKETDGSDFYLINLNRDADSLIYASYFGEYGARDHVDGGTSRFDKNGIVYQAVCASCGGRNGFPVTPDAYGQSNLSSNCNMAGFKYRFDLQAMQIIQVKAAPASGCNTLTSAFTYTSTRPGTAYLWEFGDGNTSHEEFPVHTYSSPGTYRVKFTLFNPEDCNPVDSSFLEVRVFPQLRQEINKKLCAGETIEFGGQILDKEGVYQVILRDQNDCDSTLILTLNYFSQQRTEVFKEICSGNTYTFNGKELSEPGIYTDTLPGVNGCDSLVVLNLHVKISVVSEIDSIICAGDFVSIGTSVFDTPGRYEIPLIDSSGCDSLLILNLDVISHPIVAILAEICKGEKYFFQDREFAAPGNYEWTVLGEKCDTAYSLILDTFPETEVKIGVSRNPVTADEEFELYVEPENYLSVQWSPEYIFNKADIAPAYASIRKDTWVSIVFKDENGCGSVDSVLVNIETQACLESNVFVPNAFTPNGDGINDLFLVRSMYPLDNFFLVVYNRWGEKVFETTEQKSGWKGDFKNRPAEAGAYSYILRADCRGLLIERKGNISLSR